MSHPHRQLRASDTWAGCLCQLVVAGCSDGSPQTPRLNDTCALQWSNSKARKRSSNVNPGQQQSYYVDRGSPTTLASTPQRISPSRYVIHLPSTIDLLFVSHTSTEPPKADVKAKLPQWEILLGRKSGQFRLTRKRHSTVSQATSLRAAAIPSNGQHSLPPHLRRAAEQTKPRLAITCHAIRGCQGIPNPTCPDCPAMGKRR